MTPEGLTQLAQRVQKRLTQEIMFEVECTASFVLFLTSDNQSDLDQLQHRCHNPGELGKARLASDLLVSAGQRLQVEVGVVGEQEMQPHNQWSEGGGATRGVG